MRKKPPGVEAKGQEQQDFSYRSHHHHLYNKESRGEEYSFFRQESGALRAPKAGEGNILGGKSCRFHNLLLILTQNVKTNRSDGKYFC